MDTTQIYSLVNDIMAQGEGANGLTATDTQGLISLGNLVLSSSQHTESFLNALALRIGRTIIRYRKYRNKLADMVINDFEYGGIVQKIRIAMPDAESDPSWDLTDEQSIDQYTINKPEVKQKLFYTRSPYMFSVTIQRAHLEEAFQSAEQMGGFISAIFGEVQNAIDYSLERLGRTCIGNMIAESYTPAEEEDEDATPKQNVVNLGTLYREVNAAAPATPLGLMNDPDFLRFAISTINTRIDMMQEMSVLNMPDGSALPTFTPKDRMHIYILSGFKRRLETVVQYAAFNEMLVDVASAETLTYLQNANQPQSIEVTRASDGETIAVDNIIGVVYDRDALGIYKREESVDTSPYNAKGRYYNQFYHERQIWFNDLSENFIVFTLN